MWSKSTGIIGFTGSGISNMNNVTISCEVRSIAFEPLSQVSIISFSMSLFDYI